MLFPHSSAAPSCRCAHHEIVTGIKRVGDAWVVRTTGKNLQREIVAREIVDCTGDADLVGMLDIPRERGTIRQPGMLGFRLGGYEYAALDGTVIEERYRRALPRERPAR